MQPSDCADVVFEARDGRNGSIRAFWLSIDGKASPSRFRKVFSAAVRIQASVCGLGGGLLLGRARHSVPFEYDLRGVALEALAE